MKQEFPVDEEWLPFEIHPETPGEGVLLADAFPGMDPEGFFRGLDARGREHGIRFGPQEVVSNSREALEGGEFAKEQGRHAAYHEAVFRAFFTDCRNIGRREVLLDVARGAGLEPAALEAALESGTYRQRLRETTRLARSGGIRAAPTFVIGGERTITGAQPIETFRAALRDVQGPGPTPGETR